VIATAIGERRVVHPPFFLLLARSTTGIASFSARTTTGRTARRAARERDELPAGTMRLETRTAAPCTIKMGGPLPFEPRAPVVRLISALQRKNRLMTRAGFGTLPTGAIASALSNEVAIRMPRRRFLRSVAGSVALMGIEWITLQPAFPAEGKRGGEMTVAALDLPWDPDDAIIPNLTIGSVGHSLLKWLTGERGVHAETLLVSVGALAGFAAQNAAFRSFGPPGTPLPNGAIVMYEAGGEHYYFGDRINGYLVQQSGQYAYPLWGFIAAAALEAGMPEPDMPDVRGCSPMRPRRSGHPPSASRVPPRSTLSTSRHARPSTLSGRARRSC
jgi:hypothetical protein